MPVTLLGIPAVILYLAVGWLFAQRLFQRDDPAFLGKQGILILGLLAALLHAWVLSQQVLTSAGLDLRFFHAISLVGWMVAALFMVAALNWPLENLGVIISPLAGLGLGLDLSFQGHQVLVERHSLGLDLHIAFSILAYSLLSIAAVQAVLLAVQEKHLRDRRPGGFIRALPPLETMESLLFQIIGLGFTLLTLALIKGFIFLDNIFAQHLVHKTVLSLVAWGVFAILLWGRWRFGWRGRIAIRWTLAGFAILALGYFGSKLVLELILGRV